jgi:hypothetical protein
MNTTRDMGHPAAETTPPRQFEHVSGCRREAELVAASALHQDLAGLAALLRSAKKLTDEILDGHGDGCPCHFCSSGERLDDLGSTRHLASYLLAQVTGISWALSHGLGTLESELVVHDDEDDDDAGDGEDDDAGEPEADEAAFVAGPR